LRPVAVPEPLPHEAEPRMLPKPIRSRYPVGPSTSRKLAFGLLAAIGDAHRFAARIRWTIATIVPFLARPDRYKFLKPEVTKEAAEHRGFALNYKPLPNWLTYSCLHELASILMTELWDLKPRDMIDIQSLIWVTAED
jgi:hypothetical protein